MRARRCCTSPATGACRIATRSTRSRPRPTPSSGAATRDPDSRRRAPQDHAFVGNIVEAMRAYASGRLGARPIALDACDRIIAIGSDKMMAAVAAARHNVLAPYLSPRHRGARLDQLADAMHDEGDLRAMPAAASRSGHRQGQLRVLVLQPGPAARRGRLSRRSTRACEQNAVQEKLTARWVARVSAPVTPD